MHIYSSLGLNARGLILPHPWVPSLCTYAHAFVLPFTPTFVPFGGVCVAKIRAGLLGCADRWIDTHPDGPLSPNAHNRYGCLDTRHPVTLLAAPRLQHPSQPAVGRALLAMADAVAAEAAAAAVVEEGGMEMHHRQHSDLRTAAEPDAAPAAVEEEHAGDVEAAAAPVGQGEEVVDAAAAAPQQDEAVAGAAVAAVEEGQEGGQVPPPGLEAEAAAGAAGGEEGEEEGKGRGAGEREEEEGQSMDATWLQGHGQEGEPGVDFPVVIYKREGDGRFACPFCQQTYQLAKSTRCVLVVGVVVVVVWRLCSYLCG